jgi:hypothetical protein
VAVAVAVACVSASFDIRGGTGEVLPSFLRTDALFQAFFADPSNDSDEREVLGDKGGASFEVGGEVLLGDAIDAPVRGEALRPNAGESDATTPLRGEVVMLDATAGASDDDDDDDDDDGDDEGDGVSSGTSRIDTGVLLDAIADRNALIESNRTNSVVIRSTLFCCMDGWMDGEIDGINQ